MRKIPVPLATRFSPAMKPPLLAAPADWLSCMFALIQARSPWVEMTASPGSRMNSSTGRMDPFTSAFMENPLVVLRWSGVCPAAGLSLPCAEGGVEKP